MRRQQDTELAGVRRKVALVEHQAVPHVRVTISAPHAQLATTSFLVMSREGTRRLLRHINEERHMKAVRLAQLLAFCVMAVSGLGISNAQQSTPTAPSTSSPSTPSASQIPQATAAVDALPIKQYKRCVKPDGHVTIACGARSCPGGTKYSDTVKEPTPECNGACVDMKALGWKGKGHKNNWCLARGYDGVRAAGGKGKYRLGGCCFKLPET